MFFKWRKIHGWTQLLEEEGEGGMYVCVEIYREICMAVCDNLLIKTRIGA